MTDNAGLGKYSGRRQGSKSYKDLIRVEILFKISDLNYGLSLSEVSFEPSTTIFF